MLALVGVPLLPPEHVHVTEEDGHHAEFIHRHFEQHHPIKTESIFDHQDEAALWLDTPFIGTDATHLPPVVRGLVQDLPLIQPRPLPRWTLTFDHISVHDPPWTASTGLRAPPTFLV